MTVAGQPTIPGTIAALKRLALAALGSVGPATWPDERAIRTIWFVRLFAIAGTNFNNVLDWQAYQGLAQIDQAVLGTFLYTNIAVLGADFLITLLFMRRWSAVYPVAAHVCAVLEVFTAIAWLQKTGTASSYIVGMCSMLILAYRVVFNYWVGLTTVIASVALYLGCLALEAHGGLRHAALFTVAPTAGEAVAVYRQRVEQGAVGGLVTYWMVSNFLANALASSRAELAGARAELRRVADAARLGRLSGRTLGGYLMAELLGRGGMGEVYSAHRPGRRGEVAIKLLHAHLGADEQIRARFRREAEVVRKMPPGTVATLHEVGIDDEGADYIVMERLVGEDLAALLRRRTRLTLDEALPILRRVAAALDAAHALGVVHRDLKPQNVFIQTHPAPGGGPDVRLLDFGVARLAEGAGGTMTATAALVGTPGYMAPEQVSGDDVGPATDVFAFGAIAYRVLTGEPAFPARNAAEAVFEVVRHTPPPPSSVAPELPRGVDAVLAITMAKAASARYPRASLVVDDLEHAARGTLPGHVATRAAALTSAAPGPDDSRTLTSA